ncbi:hypothetical protein BaRGS_00033813, partial [Batillaria attramentaria]
MVFIASTALEWTSSASFPNGTKMEACTGQKVTFPWTFNVTSSEKVVDIEWHYNAAVSTDSLLASYVYGNFLPVPTARQQVHFRPNAGLEISNVTVADSGVYSVFVFILGDIERQEQIVMLDVSALETEGDFVHALKFETSKFYRLDIPGSSGATVNVNGVDARLAIMEGRMGALQSENGQLTSEVTSLRQENTNLTNEVQDLKDRLQEVITQHPTNCREVQTINMTSGVYTVYLSYNISIPVYCDMDTDGGGWTVCLTFTNSPLNNGPCCVTFIVDGASDKYTLHVSGFNGTA